jgi:uncharacterized protein YidB (DUF937 family)
MANNSLGKLALVGLGILAYKNRDMLAELMRPKPTDPRNPNSPTENPLDMIRGGLGDLLDRFRNAGKGEAVDSWVRQGPNSPLKPEHVEEAIDPDTLDALTRQTGMPREEILQRLAIDLPATVDELSPDGQLREATAANDRHSRTR